MNTEDKLNQLLQEARITTSTAVDDRVLAPARQALTKPHRPGKRSVVAVSLRIAALVLLGTLIGWALLSKPQHHNAPPAGMIPSSPTQTLSLHSLHRAGREGSLETLEAHLDRALILVGPRPTALLDEVLSQSPHES